MPRSFDVIVSRVVLFLIVATCTVAVVRGLAGLASNNACRTKVQSYGISTSPHVKCVEYELPSDQEDDEVDLWYPTQRKQYDFTKTTTGDDTAALSFTVPLRKTSFGCGKLGADVWPCSVAMCLHLLEQSDKLLAGKRILEVGAGCGLPSVLCSHAALGANGVVATDFWQQPENDHFDKNRLVPTHHHGMNLQYNLDQVIQQQQQQTRDDAVPTSSLWRLDWHDPSTARAARAVHAPDVIIGSDVVYYPMDLEPLLNTLEILLEPYYNKDKQVVSSPQALLMVALPPNNREALPEFRQRLPHRFSPHQYHVEMEQVQLKYQEREHSHLF